jgi:hypothetical protein
MILAQFEPSKSGRNSCNGMTEPATVMYYQPDAIANYLALVGGVVAMLYSKCSLFGLVCALRFYRSMAGIGVWDIHLRKMLQGYSKQNNPVSWNAVIIFDNKGLRQSSVETSISAA